MKKVRERDLSAALSDTHSPISEQRSLAPTHQDDSIMTADHHCLPDILHIVTLLNSPSDELLSFFLRKKKMIVFQF